MYDDDLVARLASMPAADRPEIPARIAAYLLATDATGRWLLVQDADSPTGWRLPGRTVIADDESPAETAATATAEQTGLQLMAGPPLTVCWLGAEGCLALIFSSSVLDPPSPTGTQRRGGWPPRSSPSPGSTH